MDLREARGRVTASRARLTPVSAPRTVARRGVVIRPVGGLLVLGAAAPPGAGLLLGDQVAILGVFDGADDVRATFGLDLQPLVPRLFLDSIVPHGVPLVGCALPKAHRGVLAVTSRPAFRSHRAIARLTLVPIPDGSGRAARLDGDGAWLHRPVTSRPALCNFERDAGGEELDRSVRGPRRSAPPMTGHGAAVRRPPPAAGGVLDPDGDLNRVGQRVDGAVVVLRRQVLRLCQRHSIAVGITQMSIRPVQFVAAPSRVLRWQLISSTFES